jgi:holliday junction DNA helicase RuvA
MITQLTGKIVAKTPASIVMDVQGVGYEVNISLNTYSALQSIEQGTIQTYLQVKEDGFTLWGFSDGTEKQMFLLLIGISGVGAATARMMLSSLKPKEIAQAIIGSDLRLLESIKGIGKKTAERIILELKDKLKKQGWEGEKSVSLGNTVEADALNALIALGIARPMAEQAIKKVLNLQPAESLNLETIIKKALQNI